MEAIAAVSFAANVLQFIEYSHGLISEASEAYQSLSGTSAENVELELVTRSLRDLSSKISNQDGLVQDNGIKQIAESTRVVSTELLSTLDKLRIRDGPHRKWRTLRHAIESVWKRQKIVQMQTRLENLRNQLSIQIILQVR
jgi:hypothetical protein